MTIRSMASLLLAALLLNVAAHWRTACGAQSDLPVAHWQQEPHAYCSSMIQMAVEAIGSPVEEEYRFECTAGDGYSSDWQTAAFFKDTDLKPETEYTYQVHVRDRKSGREIAGPSAPMTVRTRSDGKDHKYRHIEKIDAAFARGDIEVIPLMITGDKDNRLNILILNRWEKRQPNAYNKPEAREEFVADCKRVLHAFDPGHPETVAPYPRYRNFFNVYAVWWADMPAYDPRDRETCISTEEIHEIRDRVVLPWRREGRAWGVAMAMFNGDGGGGGAARVPEQRVGDAMIVGNQVSSFFHEFNHTAAGIPDEYCASGLWGYGGETVSTTNITDRERIRWRAWIEPGIPVPTPFTREYLGRIGLFEGGQSRWFSHYRPTARGCLMGAGSFHDTEEILCSVCRQQVAVACYQCVDVFESSSPEARELTIDRDQTQRFAIQRVRPEPDTQRVEWRLNGRKIAVGSDEVDVTFGSLPEYTLECVVTDTTPLVRADPPYSFTPKASTRWTVRQAGGADQDPIQIHLTGRDAVFEGERDGAAVAHVTGGRPPYVYQWQDGVSTRDREHLEPGTYALTVSDSEYRTASAEVRIRQAERNAPRLESARQGDMWRVFVRGLANPSSVTCQWSTGGKGPAIENVSDGSYECVIRHSNGVQVTKCITLKTPSALMAVTGIQTAPSCGGENNGSIAFEVAGGCPPYTFAWFDGVVSNEPQRCFLAPGDYAVSICDKNLTTIAQAVHVDSAAGFQIEGLRFDKAGPGMIEIENPDPQYRYLWYDVDFPPGVPRFPRGDYAGTWTDASGRTCRATGLVVTNKGGLYVNGQAKENDYGYWIHLECYTEGPASKPVTYRVNTRQDEPFARKLRIDSRSWKGEIADGRMALSKEGDAAGKVEMAYVSHPETMDKPIHVGTQFSPTRSGSFYVAAQNTASGAISLNRIGVAVAFGQTSCDAEPVDPTGVQSAKVLAWLDATDMDADGRPDAMLRRGSIIGWRSRGNGIGFRDFVNYLPNFLNGKPVATWDNIWLQGMEKPIGGYQTVVMVRRESSMSDEGSAPWWGLHSLIGTGAYGKTLMSYDVSDAIRQGAVYVNGSKVDPFKAPMPKDFYVATYEFPNPVSEAIRRTDGRWEGEVAECLFFDGKLSDQERRGIEAYLYRKWIASVSLTK